MSVKRSFQVQLLLTYLSVELKHKIPFNFKLQCKTSKTSQEETQGIFEYTGKDDETVPINEESSFVCTMHETNAEFEEKVAIILLQVYTKQGFKAAGKAELNLANFINKGRSTLKLETKTSLEKLIITVKLELKVLKEIQNDEMNER